MKTFHDAGDAPLFHVVSLSEGGFTVMAADDTVIPVLAFSDSAVFSDDPENPLFALLNRDLAARLTRTATTLSTDPTPEQLAWRALLEPESGISLQGVEADFLNDLRVEPFLQSRWGQSTVGGEAVFNLYTPGGYPCGCVATAGAQLMRHHEFPRAAVAPATFSIRVDGSTQNATLAGGTYAWSSMPYVPASGFSAEEAEAIGRLCSDVGIASRMSYTSSASGTYSATLATALTDAFGYAGAKVIFGSKLTAASLQTALLPNLDAGFPASLGVLEGNTNGHQILADGYGYYDSTLYVHLNLGWSGTADAWYNLADIDTGRGYTFDVVDDVLFNVFPESTGEIISGRVLNASGNPIPGITVAASTGATAVSTESGVFALLAPASTTLTLSAQTGDFSARRSVTTGTSASTASTYNASAGTLSYTNGTGSSGNVWAADLILAESISITFDPQGGTLEETEWLFPLGAVYETLPTPTLAGWTFAGWYTEPSGGVRVRASDTASFAVTTLYARWSQSYAAALNPDLAWTSGGDAQWIADGASMRSGDMPASTWSSESCWIQTTVSGPGILAFDWLATSDSIAFAVDGTTAATLTGSAAANWTRKTHTLAAGSHTLLWTFTRPFLLPGNGHGWLADVTFAPTTLTLSKAAESFTHAGGGGSLGISASTAWSAASSATWLTLGATSGTAGESTLTYTAAPHTGTAKRTATITISGGGASATCTVSQEIHRVTITFHGFDATETDTFIVGTAYAQLPLPTREGYAFNGWFTEPEGAGTAITAASLADEAITSLYAAWITAVAEVKITFNPSSGSVSPTTKTYPVDKPFGSFPVPTRSSYAFAGWYTGSGGTGERAWENTTVSGAEPAVTLYANWVSATSLVAAANPLLAWVFSDESTRWTTTTGSTNSQDGLGVRTRNGKSGEKLTAQTTVLGPGVMTFAWKRASTASADTLTCAVNGTTYFTKTTTSWTTATMTCSAGSKTFTWAYTHGNSDSNNFYLDAVVWTPTILHPAPRTGTFPWKGGSAAIAVESNVAWTAETDADWITPGTPTATGVTYAVAENTGETSRSGTITLKGGGAVQTITITQRERKPQGIVISIF